MKPDNNEPPPGTYAKVMCRINQTRCVRCKRPDLTFRDGPRPSYHAVLAAMIFAVGVCLLAFAVALGAKYGWRL